MERFEYKILENKSIAIKVNSESDSMFFIIKPKEVIDLQHILFLAAADFCSKFKCSLDDPKCF